MTSVAMIIAAYNAEDTIERAISSALAEAEITQIIVADDASTDATVAKAMQLDDGTGRLKILHYEVNAGPSAVRNRALALCNTDWVGILDADDFLLPGRTRGLLEFASDADLIADDMWQSCEKDITGRRHLLLDGTLLTARSIGLEEFVLSNITKNNRYRRELGFIKPLIRRSFLVEHNLRYQYHMRLGEDFELYTRALAKGARLILVPAQGYVSVVRENSLSGRHTSADLLNLRDSDITLASQIPLTETAKAALRKHYISIDCRLQWRLLIEAVKEKKPRAAIATFCRRPRVQLYLVSRLVHQIYQRSIGHLIRSDHNGR